MESYEPDDSEESVSQTFHLVDGICRRDGVSVRGRGEVE